jgi:LmbE family N-acetylglucosaminyl deacetylase
VNAGTLADQQLFRHIPLAVALLRELALLVRPEAILTLAYEGGHPDHDACNFVAQQLSRELHVPVWEAPLYQRAGARMVVQQFIRESGEEQRVDVSDEELARKRTMWAAYGSQREVLANFDARVEVVRPMVEYDYVQPPHEGLLNYEAWGWPIRGTELCAAFAAYLQREREASPATASQRSA